MNAATARALHRSRCRDPYCPACPHDAEARKEAADEPLNTHEQAARDTWWERANGR